MGFADGFLARVTLEAVHSATGNRIVNTLHYDDHDATLPWPEKSGTMQTLADRLRDALMTPYRACFENTYVIQPIVVTDEKDPLNPDAPRDQVSSGTAAVGTLATVPNRLPIQCCAVASLRTDHIGRSFRGRSFLPPGWSEGDQDNGVWATGSAYLIRAQAFLDAIPVEPDLVFGASDTVCHWTVYSRTRRARGLDPYATDVTSKSLETAVHWLRSRAP